jgi:hypothetical protein
MQTRCRVSEAIAARRGAVCDHLEVAQLGMALYLTQIRLAFGVPGILRACLVPVFVIESKASHFAELVCLQTAVQTAVCVRSPVKGYIMECDDHIRRGRAPRL